MQLTYRESNGVTGDAVLRRSDEPRLSIEPTAGRAFDADPADWRLAAEALRIRYAASHDPMLAVSTSDMDPLPHQLRAVYSEVLPRTPLRFLLADDPGAGKTIMAGLYIKELDLRGDLERCLIVAPGSLVEQWQDELVQKFDLRFEVLTKAAVDAARTPVDVFAKYPRLIARMDQLSRHQGLLEALERSEWDLVIVDEAHRMSASWSGQELKQTKRYQLGKVLGDVARHLLLMTATPHSGHADQFQLFLALLDADRFEGRPRGDEALPSPDDLMRRMLKEQLLTMDGRPLFPERRAYTVPYDLSAGESELYEAVTTYVGTEMGRADRLTSDGQRRSTVGFALTVLQRRLASSPEAILRSLERRRDRLQSRVDEIDFSGTRAAIMPSSRTVGWDDQTIDDRLDDLDAAELEDLEDEVLDAATAARTVAELRAEIVTLDSLVALARQVRLSGTDRKWTELRSILTEQGVVTTPGGEPRKLIVFTEHRDTLTYLVRQVATLFGDPGAVVSIHGGVPRDARRKTTERFTQDRNVRVLVATDAAGEGLNLQRAHLMVNYDLPWNPNRIEQRFGRIHRIGQTETCHLWNLYASGTREGDVFDRLLTKVERQRKDFGGQVFDVLGEAFENQPLRQLLLEAIRYGDRPDVRARLEEVIDAAVGDGLQQLLAQRALNVETLTLADSAEIARQLELAQARRLQPHYLRAFFHAAFKRLGGRITGREAGRYEITRVPERVRRADTGTGTQHVLDRYERVCFERGEIRRPGRPLAELLAPGHPLLDAVVDLTIKDLGPTLEQGTVLFDADSEATEPWLLVATTESINNGHGDTISRRFAYTELTPDGHARPGGPAPYLDYEPLPQRMSTIAKTTNGEPWLNRGAEEFALEWATENTLPAHFEGVLKVVAGRVAKTSAAVRSRLISEISHWDGESARLKDLLASGRSARMRPETAYRRARDLEERLANRMVSLDLEKQLTAQVPHIRGSALVIPGGMDPARARREGGEAPHHPKDTARVERRAVDAVLAAERGLDAEPFEMPPNNPGFDIRSVRTDGTVVQIEVKGRIVGADDFTVTKNEVIHAKNLGETHRLALVEVSAGPASEDRVRYVTNAFDDTDTDDFTTTKYVKDWRKLWRMGGTPR
ncbi:helicase-related protein [Promicromonospora sp. CA-289599]|uniref:helicase-related protein n=1 Tax=Promicromonospora sp. CA-289599 TaxID=3240014 RepID=UPI003D94D98C